MAEASAPSTASLPRGRLLTCSSSVAAAAVWKIYGPSTKSALPRPFSIALPVVTGIGHEDDLTIADMVADLRALDPQRGRPKSGTRSVAVLDWLAGLESVSGKISGSVGSAQSRLAGLADRPCFRRPLERIRQTEKQLDDWKRTLEEPGMLERCPNNPRKLRTRRRGWKSQSS